MSIQQINKMLEREGRGLAFIAQAIDDKPARRRERRRYTNASPATPTTQKGNPLAKMGETST